jgi:hypothetical protein
MAIECGVRAATVRRCNDSLWRRGSENTPTHNRTTSPMQQAGNLTPGTRALVLIIIHGIFYRHLLHGKQVDPYQAATLTISSIAAKDTMRSREFCGSRSCFVMLRRALGGRFATDIPRAGC